MTLHGHAATSMHIPLQPGPLLFGACPLRRGTTTELSRNSYGGWVGLSGVSLGLRVDGKLDPIHVSWAA
eukprot:12903135-Prorocentrum_lima.AAC.1